jgi:hypothetical protein
MSMRRGKIKMILTDKQDRDFETAYDSYKNGNITTFKNWLENQNGNDILIFIKWLQSEGLEL